MSTNEVSDILTIVTCIEQANVYGVTVPGLLPQFPSKHSIYSHTSNQYFLLSTDTIDLLFIFAGHEGRIGMAAIKLNEDQQFDCESFFSHVTTYLPPYARPRFVRIKVMS